jgi:hypothetical protein
LWRIINQAAHAIEFKFTQKPPGIVLAGWFNSICYATAFLCILKAVLSVSLEICMFGSHNCCERLKLSD